MQKETDKSKSEVENLITVLKMKMKIKIKMKIKYMLGGTAPSARDVAPRDFFIATCA